MRERGSNYGAEKIWKMFRPLTNSSNRKKLAKKVIDIFEDMDYDNIYKCEQLCKDSGRKDLRTDE